MRASGILLHITSLPSFYGSGTLGDADKFIAFLKAAGQRYWQILPISPSDFVNSPYASSSTFAGNTLFIDTDALCAEGLLSESSLTAAKCARGNDFEYAKEHKDVLLREAYKNFLRQDPPSAYADFCAENAFWLEDYAFFASLKKYFNGMSWQEWPDENIRLRERSAFLKYFEELSDEIDYVRFCQFVFFKQWKVFCEKLKKADIKLIGDIPIYVAYDSADVWSHPELFELTDDLRPKNVAGVPPDYFSEDGQLWGNPLYDWTAMKKDGYAWWLSRVGHCAKLFDVLRIDHFRAFDSYYSIKYGETTARRGVWKKGVGMPFLKLLKESFPELTIIAEDLGDIPESVLKLRDECGFPGMKVLQFAFDGNAANGFLPSNYSENFVAYLGTHDNDTTLGWWQTVSEKEKKCCLSYYGLEQAEDIVGKLMTLLSNSAADLTVFSMQDVSRSGKETRMNIPGTLGCWKYMAKSAEFSNENAKFLYGITKSSDRI